MIAAGPEPIGPASDRKRGARLVLFLTHTLFFFPFLCLLFPLFVSTMATDLPKDTISGCMPNDDDTAKNIAGLYSRLQAVIDKKITDPSMNPEAKFIPLPPSLPMSPTTSSPTSTHFPTQHSTTTATNNNTDATTPRSSSSASSSSTPPAPDCSCRHILVSKESTRCSLCDRVIPLLEQLHRERDQHKQEISDLEVRVQEEQARIAEQLEEIETLQTTVADVEQRLGVKDSEFRALQSDMEMLNDKYVDEIERVAEIQHSKDMVENELEDLSRRLFEEANGMVANEKREKHQLEMAQRQLEKQLQETQERLAAEQMQLKELRQRMEDMAHEQEQLKQSAEEHAESKSITSTTEGGGGENNATAAESSASVDGSSTSCGGHVTMDMTDPMLLSEFEDFIKMSASLPLKKLHSSISFLKNCLSEDVEPCLRFGANSRLSARKVAEAIVMNTCFIEETPVGFAEEQARRPPDVPLRISASKTMLWERLSNGGNPALILGACQACGRQDQHPLPYRFRTSYFDDWACIDRYCRDRLVAVCEFYVFIRNVRQGYYNTRSLPDLYQECMRLRLQMFYAR